MKECIKCHRVLPLSEFYRCPGTNDGHRGDCKECKREHVRANRQAKPQHYREYDRERFRTNPARKAAQQARARASSSADAAKYPERRRARQAVNNAIHRGRMQRGSCEVCGAAKAEAHHEDYSKPFDVRWLCRAHHEALHHPIGSAA